MYILMNPNENRKTKISPLSIEEMIIQLFKNNCKIPYTHSEFIVIHVKQTNKQKAIPEKILL